MSTTTSKRRPVVTDEPADLSLLLAARAANSIPAWPGRPASLDVVTAELEAAVLACAKAGDRVSNARDAVEDAHQADLRAPAPPDGDPIVRAEPIAEAALTDANVAAQAAEHALRRATRTLNRALWDAAAEEWQPIQRARVVTARAEALDKVQQLADAIYVLECEHGLLTAIEESCAGQQWQLRAQDPDALIRSRERALRHARLSSVTPATPDLLASLVVLVERTVDLDADE
jgi:hypothetical protein